MTDSPMPWVKVYTKILDDPKMNSLTDLSKLLFIQLVIIAGECDAEGVLAKGDEPMTIDDIAHRLRIRSDRAKRELEEIAKLSLIYFENNFWIVCNFSKLQGRSQDAKRKLWRERQAKLRANRENVTRDTEECHALVTPTEGEKEKEKEKNTRTAPTIPSPSHPAIKIFIQETGYIELTLAKKNELINNVTSEDLSSGLYESVVHSYAMNHEPKDYGNVGWILTNLENAKRPKVARNGNGHKPVKGKGPGDVAISHLMEKIQNESNQSNRDA